eukprot:2583468-Pleurochrysis_carterae.AAC.1
MHRKARGEGGVNTEGLDRPPRALCCKRERSRRRAPTAGGKAKALMQREGGDASSQRLRNGYNKAS